MDVKQIKKVLVVKLCCIGDIIQATPSLRALKEAGCEVHFLCIKWVSDLVDMIPYVDKKIVTGSQSLPEMLKVLPVLRREKYDMIINFHRDIKSNIFIAALGAKYRAGFNWNNKGLFLTHKTVFNPAQHEALRYLSVVQGAGFAVKENHTYIKAPEDIGFNFNLSGGLKAGLFPGGGKNPGTVMVTKRWPVSRFAELIDMLKLKNITPYILGGEIDSDVAEEIIKLRPDIQFLKTGNLKQLVYVISKMDIFVAGDTGPLHMAAALGVKTIGLFGPSSSDLVGVRGKYSVNIWQKEKCAPCYIPETVHERKFLECRDNICMKNISAEKVFAEITKLLESGEK
ncbi:MAG: glycosyltransferase family 9 protein [Candidatus Goldbacteria bacterium]|nr:glycosyltransferase family 9 protein [Candidatus Goldiibacteriota bacterium]